MAEERPPLIREFSAGAVCVRGDDCAVIVPKRRDAHGKPVLALPKGLIDEGEKGAEAAARELREEAGIEGELVEKLGDVKYWYQREGKRIFKNVAFFLFRYVSGDVSDHDWEVEEARWIPLERAARELSYKGEKDMVSNALARIEQGM
jgi:8-oxo-dGTP pyrophosphatase MutT (NUDIX family)